MSEKPEVTSADVAHTIAKAGIAAIPFVGGPAAELFAAVITPPIVKRRDEWIRSLADHLEILEKKVAGFKMEDLSSNEQFVTAVLHATTIAARNHQQEKLDALKNAVLNIALKNEPDEDLQQIFLNYVDDLTPWHLRILLFFQNPDEWFRRNNVTKPNLEFGAPLDALQAAFPELMSYSGLVGQIVKDLYSRGLFRLESLGGTTTKQGIYVSRTKDMGNRFLKLISKPCIL